MRVAWVGFIFFALCSLNLNSGWGQVPYARTPTWVSADVSNYSTGCAWADIDNDGWLDLVVANGNDMARQRLVVYYNTGNGSLPTLPNWQSADIDYHGHLAVGDVNKDSYVDVAVSVYIGAAGFSQKGRVKLYLNNRGVLDATPSWISSDSMYTFSCAWGDADGDGDLDLDLVFANERGPNHIYMNYGDSIGTASR